MKRAVFPLLLALFAAACGGTETEVVTVVADATAHGKALFSDPATSGAPLNAYACSTCHVAEPSPGDTRLRAGAPLAGALDRPTYWGGVEADLLRSINFCRLYFMQQATPWTEDEPMAEDVYAYLASLGSLPSASTEAAPFTVVGVVADLPEGDATRGSELYTRSCAYCHGAKTSGAGRLTELASRLPDDPLEEHAADGFDATEQRVAFVEKVRHGGFYGYGGVMPPFSLEALSDEELADVLAYLSLY